MNATTPSIAKRFKRFSLKPENSMAEVPHSREDHRDASLVGRGDHFGVAHATTRLDDCNSAVVGHDIEPVAKGKESIRRHDRAGERETGVRRLDRGDPRRVDPAHLSGADAERAAA